jgi:threonine/homoserine/homoserine lactone efflux protein
MSFLIDGIKVGFILCFLLGPIFFTLIQTGVEQGFRAGATVGLGIWMGDILYMLTIYWGVSQDQKNHRVGNFSLVFGSIGSIILVLFGLGTLLIQPTNLYLSSKETQRRSSYFSLWLKGFLINGFNPFTVFFWLGIMTTVVINQNLGGQDASWFFTGIIATVVLTDMLKILMAKKIRKILKPIHLIWVRKVSGVALIIFGVVLIIRVLMGQ